MSPVTFKPLLASRPLRWADYKTLMLSALGAMLEIYDFVIFVFLMNELSELFFPANMPQWVAQLQMIGIFAAGFLVRPLSGIVIAHFSDKLGRKRMFALSLFLMAVPTLCIGLLPTYATLGILAPLLLLLLRIMQGIAIGGEVPSAWVFVAEHIPPNRMGLGLGLLTCGISGGSLLGALVLIGLKSHFNEAQIHEFAWRLPFLLGGVFGLVSVYMRRFLSETPVFKEIAAKRQLSREFPLKTVLRDHLPASTLAFVMTWTTASVVIIVILLLPGQLQAQLGLPKSAIFQANALATIMMVAGNISLGWLSDRLGTRSTYLFCWTGILISGYYFFTQMGPGMTLQQLTVNYMFMGYFAGVTVTMPTVSVRAFPAAVRVTGVSFAYNIAFALSSLLTPVAVNVWSRHDPLAPAHYLAILAICSIIMGFTPLAQRGYQSARQSVPSARSITSIL